MNKFLASSVTAFLAALLVMPSAALSQAPAAKGGDVKVPRRTPDGKPDFGGIWDYPKAIGQRDGATTFDQKLMAPLKPGGDPFLEPRTGDPYHDEPRAFCFPSGFPSNMFAPYAVQIVQSKDYMVIVHEFMRMTRLIPLDGRPHHQGIEPTYFGDSIGHWDGDTLVIDSTNFKRWSLDDWYYQNRNEYRMHSDALRTIDPELPLTEVSTMEERLSRPMAGGRIVVSLLVIFAFVALAMGSAGLYGVISYSASRRTAEFAMRITLGAPRREIFRLVAGGALQLLLVGGGIGAVLAFGVSQVLRRAIFGVSFFDPVVLTAVPLALLVVVLAASYLPARRAMKVDPVVALRYE